MKSDQPQRQTPWILVLIFFIFAIGIVATGVQYYRKQVADIKGERQQNLAAIADLKVRQIVNWLKQREGDALIIENSSAIARYFKNYTGTRAQKEELTHWLDVVCKHNGYSSAVFYDTKGAVQYAYGEDNEIGASANKRLQIVMKRQKFGMSDLHISQVTKKATIGLIIPLVLWEQQDHPTVGALFFRIDPYQILYPLIQSWPTPSRTSETLLVRRAGEEVVFLNELRHQKNTALTLRFPLTKENLPGSKAARGEEGVVEGIDYRGVPVLAVTKKVPDSTWSIVAKVDQDEIYRPLKEDMWTVAFIVAVTIIMSGAFLGLWWRNQRALYYRRQYEAEMQRQVLLTERRQAEETIQVKEELIHLTGEMAKVGGWEFDTETLRGTWTDEVARIHDLPPGQATNVALGMSYYSGESRRKIENAIKEAIEFAKPYDLELEMVGAEGRQKWVRTMGMPITANNKVVKVRGILQDITELKRAERALSAEKERLSVTLRSIGDGVVTTDRQGTITLLNKVAEELTGWSMAEAMGRPLSEVFHIINEQTRERCENPVDKVLKSGGIVDLANHTALIRRDGTEIVLADSGAPIRDQQSEIIGVVLVFRDITDKEKINQALQNAQKLEAVGVLAAGIAHDFNNLLGGIFGYLELARDQAEKGNAAAAAKTLYKGLGVFDRAKHLTQQLLTFSKGGLPIRKTLPIADHVRKAVLFALSGSSISPEFSIPADVWLCDFDENQMAQVFDNIVINARQAMPLGGKIDVTIRNAASGEAPKILPRNNYVCVSIRDYGAGIVKEHLPRIFDPFFTTKHQGNGLGLAVSYAIVKKHDGIIEAESVLGEGTTFHLYLPASSGQAFVMEKVKAPAYLHQGEGRILVMDDEEFILDVISQMLRHMGYEVLSARNGDEAVALAREAEAAGRHLSAAILDLTIPGGRGGKEVLPELLAIVPSLKVVASSGYSEDPVMARPSEYGFADRLIKPYRMDDLARMLGTLWGVSS